LDYAWHYQKLSWPTIKRSEPDFAWQNGHTACSAFSR
jgi:hypothetical protein